MAEVDDWEPVKPAAEVDDWQSVGGPEPPPAGSGLLRMAGVPDAFFDRVRMGQAMTRILGKASEGAAEGWGETTPTGVSNEFLDGMAHLGVFHDPTRGRPGPLQLVNEAVIMPTAVAFNTLMRGINAGLHGAGGFTGQLLEELGTEQGMANRAKNEVINAGNWAMIEAGFGRFSRPKAGPGGPIDEVVGGLPRADDFKVGAAVLTREKPVNEPIVRRTANDQFEMSVRSNDGKNIGRIEFAVTDDAVTVRYPFIESEFQGQGFGVQAYQALVDWTLAQGKEFRSDRNVSPSAVRIYDALERRGYNVIRPDEAANRPVGTNDALQKAYDEIKEKQGRIGTVYIGDLIERSGLPTEQVREVLRQAARDGDVTLARSSQADKSLSAERQAGALRMDDEVFHTATFKSPIGASTATKSHSGEPFRIVSGPGATTEARLQQLWQERGVTPAEAVADAQRDAWVKNELTAPIEGKPIDPAVQAAAEAETARIISGQKEGPIPTSLGADVTRDPPLISPEVQPLPPPGTLAGAFKGAAETLFDIGRDIRLFAGPMALGTRDSMAMGKDFANAMRRNRWEWARYDDDIVKRFNPEQRKRMWMAADEESVARQLGESREHQGLVTLEPAERAAVEDLQARAQVAWVRAKDLGMVTGEGLPSYTPRMVINMATAGSQERALALNSIGTNLRATTGGLKKRKYMTAEETEAAAKELVGMRAAKSLKSLDEIEAEIAAVELARDIRALPLATAKLEDAIAGRTLVKNIKEYGERTGTEVVAEGFKPDKTWFTIDHPALKTWRPKFKEKEGGGFEVVKDADGNTIFEQVPLYIHSDFEGPLKAILTRPASAPYNFAMELKGKTMSLIMNSPMIHNAVEYGRAFPAMPGKLWNFKVYFEGNRAKNNIPLMQEAIDNGLVPIGKRFFNQDITSIMEAPDLTPGRSWTAKVLAAVPGLFDEGAGVAVKQAIDKAGDFWHNTLLWDRIGDLQMGLYTNFRTDLMAKGVDQTSASRVAAHWANRYAGALPQEAMSDAGRKWANMLLFSRSFTMGNLGVMKDMLTGLPKDVVAQIERDAGFPRGAIGEALPGPAAEVAAFTKTMARRKAMVIVALDIALFHLANSVLQSALSVMRGDNTMDEEMHGYTERFSRLTQETKEHPLSLISPLSIAGAAIGAFAEGPIGAFVGGLAGAAVSAGKKLSSTAENEPGKEGRIKIGHDKDGTAIYGRFPVGKIGEEYEGYFEGPLDMLRRKLGTVARPGLQVLSNDKGFGRKVYDPGNETTADKAWVIAQIVAHFATAQAPEGQLRAGMDLVKGDGDKYVNLAQSFGPVAGLTFSKGAPGGEAVGELYAARGKHQYAVDAALGDIRKQIQHGDVDGAIGRMQELGIPAGLQRFYIRTSINPSLRLSPKAVRDFYLYATPEQRERLERAR